MKYGIYLVLCLFLTVQINGQSRESGTNQEVKIPFGKGTVKICSSKNFKITGYDGNEVIIEGRPNIPYYGNLSTSTNGDLNGITLAKNNRISSARTITGKKLDTILRTLSFFNYKNQDQRKGLKKLGKGVSARDMGIYLNIEQKGNELLINDDLDELFMTLNSDSYEYEIMIPNTVRLQWNSGDCKLEDNRHIVYFAALRSWKLKDFKGEAEITSSMKNLHLTDVSGPVSINTIGANVTVVFDKTTPNQLYSIYSNNGFIDVQLPRSSNVLVDAKADEIFSDIDFKILEDEVVNDSQQMKLRLSRGNVKMKLDAGLGNIYLRKK